jgi:hypothetical protein
MEYWNTRWRAHSRDPLAGDDNRMCFGLRRSPIRRIARSDFSDDRLLALQPAGMLLGVELKPDAADQIELGFEKVDVMLLVLHEAFEQIA